METTNVLSDSIQAGVLSGAIELLVTQKSSDHALRRRQSFDLCSALQFQSQVCDARAVAINDGVGDIQSLGGLPGTQPLHQTEQGVFFLGRDPKQQDGDEVIDANLFP